MATMALAPAPPSGPSPSPTTGSSSLPVPVRPGFNSRLTSDRLREGAGLRLPSNIQKGRTSVFREMGLEDDAAALCGNAYLVVRDDIAATRPDDDDDATSTTTGTRGVSSPQQQQQQTSRPWYAKLAARPALAKRQSSQGRIAIPAVNVVGPDSH